MAAPVAGLEPKTAPEKPEAETIKKEADFEEGAADAEIAEPEAEAEGEEGPFELRRCEIAGLLVPTPATHGLGFRV